MRNVFVMPLRKGSKSIKNKNIRTFVDRPLFCWAIDALLKTNVADEIWIATDSEEIELLSKERYGSNISIYRRSPESATDTAPSIDVVLEFILNNTYTPDTYLTLIQATSPLTIPQDFMKLHEGIEKHHYDSYIACTRVRKFRWRENGISLDYNLDRKPRRQDYEGFLVESGAFYCSTISQIVKTQSLVSGKIGIVELGNEALIDIDNPVDWAMGEAYLKTVLNIG